MLRHSSPADSRRSLSSSQLAEKLNAMNLAIDQLEKERDRRWSEARDDGRCSGPGGDAPAADPPERRAQDVEAEGERQRQRAAGQLRALAKFVRSCPRGTYEEYAEFLLMGGGGTEGTGGEDYNALVLEDFYDGKSEHRKIWNDHLTLGLEPGAEGRAFVPAAVGGGGPTPPPASSTEGARRQRMFSAEALRGRALSEGGRLKKHLAQVDKQRISQGLGSAVGAISNASSFALKPLRDLQAAEQMHAERVDAEEEEARRERMRHSRAQKEQRDLAEMMQMKKEAEERCLRATTEHLVSFVREHPRAGYHQWIEELHPENAHDGALLEGLGKTIDHRFFVEDSDHRRLWNEHRLLACLGPCPGPAEEGREFVPARERRTEAPDLLTGPPAGAGRPSPRPRGAEAGRHLKGADLILLESPPGAGRPASQPHGASAEQHLEGADFIALESPTGAGCPPPPPRGASAERHLEGVDLIAFD